MSRREVSPGLGIPLYLDTEGAHGDSRTLITISDGQFERTVLFTRTESVVVDPDEYVVAPEERQVITPIKASKNYIYKAFLGAAWFTLAVLFSAIFVTATGFVHARIVLSGSMEPTIKIGDIVVETPLNGRIPNVGEVVTYTGKRVDGTEVADFTHRIVGGDAEQGFVMKGDANKDADVQQPTPEDIKGIVIFVIPALGKLLTLKNIINLLLATFGIWLIVDALRDRD